MCEWTKSLNINPSPSSLLYTAHQSQNCPMQLTVVSSDALQPSDMQLWRWQEWLPTVLILTVSRRCSPRERSAPKTVQKSKCDIITENVTYEPWQILYLEVFFILRYHRFCIFVSVKSFRWSLSGYKCVRCTNSHRSWWKCHVLWLRFSSFTPLPFPDSAFDSSSSPALISSSLVSFARPLLTSLSRFLSASSSPVHLLLLLLLSTDLNYLLLQTRR